MRCVLYSLTVTIFASKQAEPITAAADEEEVENVIEIDY